MRCCVCLTNGGALGGVRLAPGSFVSRARGASQDDYTSVRHVERSEAKAKHLGDSRIKIRFVFEYALLVRSRLLLAGS